MGVLQPRDEPDLPLEALGSQRLRQLGMEHLEGHRAVVLEIAGEEDCGHAPAPKLALECIATAQPALELRLQVGHRAFRREETPEFRYTMIPLWGVPW